MTIQDDWSDLQAMWAEQDVPDVATLRKKVRRGTLWLTLFKYADWASAVGIYIFAAYLIQEAPKPATYVIAAGLCGFVTYALYWSTRWRRGILTVTQEDQRSLIAMQAKRCRRAIHALKFCGWMFTFGLPMGGLSAYITDPTPKPLDEFLIRFLPVCAVIASIGWIVCYLMMRRQRRCLAQWEAMLTTLDNGVD